MRILIRKLPSLPVLAIVLAGCTTAQVATATATVNDVLSDVQTVCQAVIYDSTGSVATLIGTFPLGTTALAIADTICTYIDSVQPLPTTTVASAKLMGRAKAGARLGVAMKSVTVNGVVINFAKTQ